MPPTLPLVIGDAIEFLLSQVIRHGDGDATPVAQRHLEAIHAAKATEAPAAAPTTPAAPAEEQPTA